MSVYIHIYIYTYIYACSEITWQRSVERPVRWCCCREIANRAPPPEKAAACGCVFVRRVRVWVHFACCALNSFIVFERRNCACLTSTCLHACVRSAKYNTHMHLAATQDHSQRDIERESSAHLILLLRTIPTASCTQRNPSSRKIKI